MNYKDWTNQRNAFKARVVELLKDPRYMSYPEVAAIVGVSASRVSQIRKEFGLPRRRGGLQYAPVTPAAEAK
jgi:transposase-like protein